MASWVEGSGGISLPPGVRLDLAGVGKALGIAALLATAVHLTSLWLDEFIEFTVSQLLPAPWTSSYEPCGVSLGWLAMLFLVLAAASGALRRLLPQRPGRAATSKA